MEKLVVNNNFKKYKYKKTLGYEFYPKNKNITNLNIINEDYIKVVLKKRIKKDINKTKKAINLMSLSNITEVSDCDIMIKELSRLTNKIIDKYIKYFNELEFFDLIKQLFFLNMQITAKKKIIIGK